MRRPFWRLLLALAIVCGGLGLILMRVVMTRGLDLTDEAFYLLWMQEPGAYDLATTLFGFQLHPLYVALGGSVVLLRTVGAMALMFCGAGVAYAFMRSSGSDHRPDPWQRELLIVAAAVAQLLYYVLWLPTPSYNLLTVLAGLLLCLALAALTSDEPHSPAASGAVAAVAGTLAFVAKPTCGPTFALIFALGLLFVARDWQAARRAALSAFVVAALLLVAMGVLIGGAHQAWTRIENYLDVFGVASPAGLSLLESLGYLFHRAEGQALAMALAAILLGATRLLSSRRTIWLAAAVGALSVASVGTAGWALYQAPSHYFALGPLLTSMVLSALAIAFLSGKDAGGDRRWRAALICSAVPWAIAYGTSNDLAYHASLGSGVSAVLLLAVAHRFAGRWRAVTPLVVVVLLALTGSGLWRAWSSPYRLDGPIWTQNSAVTVGRDSAVLLVSPAAQRFIAELQSAAAAAGLRPGAAVLDLTGESPGISYVLGARPLGTPWLFGSYPFSERLARWVVSHAGRERMASAWLVAGDGPIAFGPAFIKSLGLNLADDYDLVSEITHPIGKWTLRLYAPRVR